MGLKSLGVRVVANQIERNVPMVKKALAWLNAKPGRKRGIGAAFGSLVALMVGFDAAFDQLCKAEYMAGPMGQKFCSLDLLAMSQDVESFWAAMEPALVGTASLGGIVMTAWGWMQARKEKRA